MKKIILLFALLATTTLSFAQNNAKKLLDEAIETIKKQPKFSANFSVSINGKNHNGSLDVDNQKYVIKLMGITQLYDGNKTYHISPSDEEVTISKSKAASDYNLANLLTMYQKGFTYTMDTKKTENKRNIQYIKLVPTDKNNAFKEIVLGIDTQNKQLYKKTDVLKNGTKTTLTIQSFNVYPKFSKTHFTFNKSAYSSYFFNEID
ncbi:outer membrane lipoprotein carrier protein LolA [Capnocytophaga sp. ARDL2]|uniref:LolA family protein n=1 Tax=Capnocytophaga sp. ARDL2 TaxID=3238809 RepID=UPI00355609D8